MTRLIGLAAFEVHYQAWRLTFLATLIGLACVPAALVSTGFGPAGDAINGAFVVTESLTLLSLTSVFALPLLCVHAALRDDEHGMRGLVDSTPTSRRTLLAVRFGGVLTLLIAVLACCTLLLAVLPLALPPRGDRLVPFAAAPYVRAFAWLVVPNALWCTAVLFGVAAATRSTLATFVASVCIYAGYMVTALMVDSPLMAGTRAPTPELLARTALLDPFGLSAFFEQTRYLTPSDRDRHILSLSGHLLQNRALMLLLGALCITPLSWLDERLPRRGGLLARWWPQARRDGTATAREEVPETASEDSAARSATRASAAGASRPRTRGDGFGVADWLLTTRGVMALEGRLLLRSWPFALLLIVWVVVILIEADGQLRGGEYGTRVLASTAQLADAVPQGLELLGAICVLYFAVEVFGREQLVRFAGIRDATPAAGTALLAGKFLALLLVPVLLTMSGYGATVVVHVIAGGLPIEWEVLVAHMAASFVPLAITTAMAAALQTLLGQRWLAMLAGLVVVVFGAQGAAFGAEHPLWRFGAAPPIAWSDLGGYGPGLSSWVAFQLTWAVGALVLLLVAAGLWSRGESRSLLDRCRDAPQRLRQALGASGVRVLGVTAVLFAVCVAGMTWLTTVRQPWTSSATAMARRIDYERRYARLQSIAQPSITHATLAVALEPRRARATVRGVLRLSNITDDRVDTVYATFPLRVARVTLDALPAGVTLVTSDTLHRVYTLALRAALLPDSSLLLPFAVSVDGSGIRADGNPVDVTANGTFLHSSDVLPRFGFVPGRLLRDSVARAERGLPARSDSLLLPASLGDSVAAVVGRHGQSPAWFSADVTIETDADQIALGPGQLVSQSVRGTRSTWVYRRAVAATPAFVIVSGRYAVHRDSVRTAHGVVPVEIWHNPRHAEPAKRLREVTEASLAQLARDFGRYPHDGLRVVEVASYWRFGAYAMPGSIYLTETRGMLSDARAGTVDLLMRRIGHEVAHEWWGHAVNPLDVEGRLLLVETMAKYAEQRLVRERQGESMVHEMLAFEEDRYFRSRQVGEASLLGVVDEDALFYGKGALAMHAMRHLLSDSAVLRVARELLQTHAGPRGTATARDFLNRLEAAAPDAASRARVREWFADRVVYDIALDSGALRPVARGTKAGTNVGAHMGTHVTARFRATRLMAHGVGARATERSTPLDGFEVPLGLRDAQGAWHVLRVRAIGGVVALDTVVPWPVTRLEVDPERVLLERDRSNNVVAGPAGR